MNIYEWIAIVFLALFVVCVAIAVILVMIDVAERLIEFLLGSSILCALAMVVFGILGAIQSDDKQSNACKQIGGNYQVVGHETTYVMSGKVMVPTEVDVYGCVKGEHQ